MKLQEPIEFIRVNWRLGAVLKIAIQVCRYMVGSKTGWTDAELIQHAQQGEEKAFVEIYERYQPSIYTYVFYRVGDPAQAEDVTAEVFVRLVQKIHTIRYQERPLLTWLYTVAGNLITDYHRRRSRITWMPLDEEIEAGDTDPAKTAESRLTQKQLVTALSHLTEEQRQVVLLKFVERRGNSEIAAILGKNEGSVKALQNRALAALRRWWEKGA